MNVPRSGSIEEAARLCSRGAQYHQAGQCEEALANFQQALPILTEAGEPALLAVVLHNIGLVYHSLEDHGQALVYFQRA